MNVLQREYQVFKIWIAFRIILLEKIYRYRWNPDIQFTLLKRFAPFQQTQHGGLHQVSRRGSDSLDRSCRLFRSDFSVQFILHQFNGIWDHWLLRTRLKLKNVLFLFLLAKSSCILQIIILHKYKSLTHKKRYRLDSVILQYTLIVGLIQLPFTWCKCPPFLLVKVPYILTEHPTYFTIGVIGASFSPNCHCP